MAKKTVKKAQEFDNTNTGAAWTNKFTTWRKNPETGKDEAHSPGGCHRRQLAVSRVSLRR